jgi:hypothetical protein
MKNQDALRERFLRDPLPVRMGNLAATLGRVASSARRPSADDIVSDLLEESQWLVEWTAADADPDTAGELVDIQVMISIWRAAWPQEGKSHPQRALLSLQSSLWSEQVLERSGLTG